MIYALFLTLLIIAYYLIVAYVTFLYFVMNVFGMFNIVFYEFGSTNVIFLFIIAIAAVLILPILVFKVRKRYRPLILIVCLGLYCTAPLFIFEIVCDKYKTFSYEEWNENPVVRQIMYSSLLEEDGILGKTSQEAKDEIGEPDYEEQDGVNGVMYAYKTSPGTIRIYIKNDIVSDIDYTPSW